MDLESIIRDIVDDHLGLTWQDGTYLYNLTRCKSAFNVGTVTIDDFEEIDLKFSQELVDKIIKAIKATNNIREVL